MSLKIKNQLGIFDLQNDFSIEIEDTSPIYNERGSQSVPATLPASRNNLSLITHVHRPDSTYSPAPDARVTVSDGVYNRIGKMNITQASKSGGIVSNIGFSNSTRNGMLFHSVPSLLRLFVPKEEQPESSACSILL